ncbi:MAG: aldehyde ferredoxin oxidoreductase family protein [Clostridium sp.]|nr:aldehyde ferredoxin oxidoreductase family protein [Clostridium sp.]
MAYGYWGKILEIDLDSRSTKIIPIKDEEYKKYLSGSGLGAKILYEQYDYKKPALSAENPLIFINGFLTGLPAPTAAKSTVVSKSPLTGIWGESIVGGFWGAQIRKTGFDGFVVKGKAEKPVAIYINDDNVEFLDAKDLWGKDVYETEELLKERTDKKAEVACVGIAGENLVSYAGIMIGGRETRAAGRCGLGTLMGFKNLKAIAVKGTKQPEVYDSKRLRDLVKEFMPNLIKNAEVLHDYGTLGTIQGVESEGDLPIKNWTLGSWEEGATKTSGQMLAQTCQTGHYACYTCPVRCGKSAEVRVGAYKGSVGHGPEYETGAAFGALILNDDLDYICAANDLCNRYGLDTIETGNTIAMAIECYENGLLTKEDTDGIELKWGIKDELLEVIEKIAHKEGIGKILAKGSRKAAEEIGGIAKEFAIQTKGLSYAMHDPRAYTTMVAGYATTNRGACHLGTLGYFSEGGAVPRECVGFSKKTEPHGFEGKAEYAIRLQNFMNLFDALGLCKFIMLGHITPEIMKNWVNAVTGWNLSTEEMELIGDRLFNLKRMYNVRLGISRKDDVLPPRLLMHDRKTGGAGGSIPNYTRILKDYYDYREWTPEGIPTEEKLNKLGILSIAQ